MPKELADASMALQISRGAQARARVHGRQSPVHNMKMHPEAASTGPARGSEQVCNASITEVVPGDNEPPEALLRRFKKAVHASGLYKEVKKRRYHETAQDVKKRKEAEPRRPRIRPRTLADAESDATLRGGAVPSSRRPGTIPKPKK